MPPVPDNMYFARRGGQSLVAMNDPRDRGSRLVHAQLAKAYDGLTNGPPADGDRELLVAIVGTGRTAPAGAVEGEPADTVKAWANEGGAR